jgi:lipoate-protein ligase A
MRIRFIDAGTVSGLRSQTIYHGLGYAQKPETPDTIVLATPGTPYMCIGFFQDLENELDINYCRTKGLPVIRRETGGGAVYIDQGQLFVQWIFQQSSLPRRVDQRFQLFVKPLIETYKFFGINAYYHPINDVHVDGKKIVGTGAGTIGEGEVVTGNFLFDFNYDTMIEAINVPTDDFRAAVRRNLSAYLTTFKQELEEVPERSEVIKIYRQKCEEILGLGTDLGSFTDEELRQMEVLEEKFVEKDWLYQTKRKPAKNKLFKVHLGVWIGQVSHDIDEGTLTALITMKDNHIIEIKLAINGFEITEFSLLDLEAELVGVLMEPDVIAQKVNLICNGHLQEEWRKCIYMVKELQLQQTGNG